MEAQRLSVSLCVCLSLELESKNYAQWSATQTHQHTNKLAETVRLNRFRLELFPIGQTGARLV